MRRISTLVSLLTLLHLGAAAQNVVNITDASITAGQKVKWTKDNVYLCDGLVFVEEGAELTIEAGTVVKFTPRADVGNPSALVIAKGAKIYADGTRDNPIIFTAQADDVNNPTDLGPRDVSLWGGIVILGNGVTQKNGNATASVEGIPTGETRAIYGGNDNNDNSGVLRYVSIRHGGRILTGSNELNGLTLAGVGSKTVLEYVEVYANSDDGIEFFGGAPNLKYAVVAFAEDDSYDWDEVYTGKGQFWFSIQRPDAADLGGEFDGTTPDDATPYSNGTVFNWTHVGTGTNATAGGIGLLLRAGTAGTIANSIFTESRGKAIEVQDKNAPANDAYEKLKKGELKILNNLFWANGTTNAIDASASGVIRVTSGNPTQDEPTAATLVSHMATNKNLSANPVLRGVSRQADGGLDPRPARSGAAYTGDLAVVPNDPFFTKVDFKGAFGANPEDLWLSGWSALARNGHLPKPGAGQTINIVDSSLVGGKTYTWTKENTYVLDGLVFLEEGGVLNIEAGTVVKFTPRADVGNPSALVIAKGAKIYADGTRDNPIIFTAQADDVNNPTDLGPRDVSLWGGIVILGNGVTQKNGNATASVEGIPTGETRAIYGGNDNNDNSGVLRYVSIRHGGRILTGSNELNGLTLAGVGSKTVLEYVEVYANSDDGIEFFGGAPNLKYAVVAFAEDDSYDWDEVYTGKGQFWFSIQRPDAADLGGEFDGTTPDDATPYSNGTVFNWTHIGTGTNATAGGIGLLLRAGTAGTIANSIFTESRGKAIEVQDKNAPANDAYEKLKKGELKILNNLFWANGTTNAIDASASGVIRVTSGNPTQDEPTAATLVGHMATNKNLSANPMLRGVSRQADGGLDPRPARSGAAYTGDLAVVPNDPFFTKVDFKGAFGANPDDLWLAGWSSLARNGHLRTPGAGQTINIVDSSLVGGKTYTWTKENTYVLDGLVFLEEGGVLNIEAGTVVKFTPRADVGNPSALVIAKGAKIYADGTRDNPIIFTAQADDVNNPTDLGPRDVSLWGGIVILGNGVTQKNGNATASVEGIPTGETRAIYGGNDNNDDSGVLRYVSIRHGGRILTGSNELNGLTLAGVGSKTVLEYVEVYANSDDGIEFFGGSPNLKYAVVAFAEDDSYDWDEVYTGKGQFWFSIQRPDAADLGGEFDGTTPDDATPYSNGTVFNWTHVGTGTNATAGGIGLLLRAGTAGTIANSIFTESRGKAIEVQDKNAPANDAYEKLKKGELKILNNLFWANGTTNAIDASASGVIRVTSGNPTQDEPTAATLINHMVSNGNLVANPMLASVSRIQDGRLDPRPSLGAAAYGPLASLPSGDSFFTSVNFKGAFSNDYAQLWIRKWTSLERNGHLGFIPTSIEEFSNSLLSRFQIYPNPTSDYFTLESDFDEPVQIEVFSIDGKRLRSLRIDYSGMNRTEMSGLGRGIYMVKFTTESGKFAAKKLIVE